MASSTGWCTTRIASRCAGARCVKRKERKRKSESIARRKAVEKTGTKRPWKSLRDFHFSHSFNNNKLDDRDHFLQNAKTSVASLRRLITPTRNADHDQPGTLITFIGIRTPCIRAADPQKHVDFRIYLVSKCRSVLQPRNASRSALQYQTSGAPTARFKSEGAVDFTSALHS